MPWRSTYGSVFRDFANGVQPETALRIGQTFVAQGQRFAQSILLGALGSERILLQLSSDNARIAAVFDTPDF